MGQYQGADRPFQFAWLQVRPIRRWTQAVAHVLGPTGCGVRGVLAGHEARRHRTLCCVAVYLHNRRVAIVMDWKLRLGPGGCVSSRPPPVASECGTLNLLRATRHPAV